MNASGARVLIAVLISVLAFVFLSPVNAALAGVIAVVLLIVITFYTNIDPRF